MKIIYQEEKAKNVENFHEICLHTSMQSHKSHTQHTNVPSRFLSVPSPATDLALQTEF